MTMPTDEREFTYHRATAVNDRARPGRRFARLVFALGSIALGSVALGGVACSGEDSPGPIGGGGGGAAGTQAGAGGALSAGGGAGGSNAGSSGGAQPGGSSGAGSSNAGAAGSAAGASGAAGASSEGGAGTGGGGSAAAGAGGMPMAEAGAADARSTDARGSIAETGATGDSGAEAGAASGEGGVLPMLRGAMVINPGAPTAGDNVMLARMRAHGIQTTTFSDAAVTAAAVANMDVIVVSSSAESAPLARKITDVAVPILCIENGQYRNLNMTGPSAADWGADTGQTAVRITMPGPLVGLLTGTVTIAGTAGDLGWGIPAPTALQAAVTVATPSHVVIFGYAKGDRMVGMVAPARRAGFAIREALAASLTADGTKLFDAGLEWVLQ